MWVFSLFLSVPTTGFVCTVHTGEEFWTWRMMARMVKINQQWSWWYVSELNNIAALCHRLSISKHYHHRAAVYVQSKTTESDEKASRVSLRLFSVCRHRRAAADKSEIISIWGLRIESFIIISLPSCSFCFLTHSLQIIEKCEHKKRGGTTATSKWQPVNIHSRNRAWSQKISFTSWASEQQKLSTLKSNVRLP